MTKVIVMCYDSVYKCDEIDESCGSFVWTIDIVSSHKSGSRVLKGDLTMMRFIQRRPHGYERIPQDGCWIGWLVVGWLRLEKYWESCLGLSQSLAC